MSQADLVTLRITTEIPSLQLRDGTFESLDIQLIL